MGTPGDSFLIKALFGGGSCHKIVNHTAIFDSSSAKLRDTKLDTGLEIPSCSAPWFLA